MKHGKILVLACILSTFLTVTAFAVPEESDPPEALTPEGNLTLVDDVNQENKQFITVQSKNGNYFYLVVDRSGEKENVYFLNLVDESDLLALIEEEPVPEKIICSCIEPCIGGTMNHDCPVCDVNTAGCQAIIEEPPMEEPEEPEIQEPAEETESPAEPTDTPFPWAIVITVVGLLSIGVVYYFKFLRKKSQFTPPSANEEEEYENPDEYAGADENPEDSLL